MAEGERVAPKKPLKPDDGYAHHGQPDEGQGRLSAGEPAVEEAHARHHEQDEGRRGEDPCEVTRLRRRGDPCLD